MTPFHVVHGAVPEFALGVFSLFVPGLSQQVSRYFSSSQVSLTVSLTSSLSVPAIVAREWHVGRIGASEAKGVENVVRWI